MSTHYRTLPITGLLLIPLSALRFAGTEPSHPRPAQPEVEACSLLTTADASTALGASSRPGKRLVEASPNGCVWADDPAASDTSRRVIVVTHSLVAFRAAMHTVITTITIEPVSGVGEEAFYQVPPTDSPFLWVRKGDTAFSIRILTRSKPRPFTVEQEKAKELTLAKAVVTKL
jgi:hypothetical protein